jgi:hypothetical protein
LKRHGRQVGETGRRQAPDQRQGDGDRVTLARAGESVVPIRSRVSRLPWQPTGGDACGLFERFTERARQAVTRAQTEALTLGHGAVETEHQLLGLLAMEDALVDEVFTALGITTGPVRELVMQRLGPGTGPRTEGQLPFSPLAEKVLEVSLRQTESFGHRYVGTEHLLLGLVRVSEGGASQILRELGAHAKNVELEVRERVPGPIPARPVTTLPQRQAPAPVIEFRPAADSALRRVLMVAAGLAMTDARETFGIGDLLHAFARDPDCWSSSASISSCCASGSASR